MRINLLSKNAILIAFTALIAISCGKNNQSRATGWGINSKKGGFQYNVEFAPLDHWQK